MAQGYLDYVAGQVLTAAQLEDYCELQTTMRFATTAARNTALSGVLIEGLRCFLVDSNVEQVYSGTAWSTVGPVHGGLTTWTPVITQSNAPTFTNTLSWYSRVGRMVTGAFSLAVTSAGTASNTITVTFPVTAATGTDAVGTGYWTDATVGTEAFVAVAASTTTMKFYATDPAFTVSAASRTVGSGGNANAAALASGDVLSGTFTYQAAADA